MTPKTSADANKPAQDCSTTPAGRVTAVEVSNPPERMPGKSTGKSVQTRRMQHGVEAQSSRSRKIKFPLTLEKSHEKIQVLSDQLELKRTEITKLKDAKKRSQEQKTALSDKLKAEKEKRQKIGDDLQKLQHERFENAVSHELPPIPDEEVHAYLSEIFINTKILSKQWAVGKWDQIDEKRQSEIFMEFESRFGKPLCSDRMKDVIRKGEIPPHIIVNAAINAALCNETFSRPFGWLRGSSSKLENGAGEVFLAWLIETATADSHGSNHIVQAKILRAIDMPFAVDHWSEGTRCSPAIRRLRGEYIESTCSTIVQLCRPFLKSLGDITESRRRTELLDIVRECHILSSSLTLQYSRVKILFWNELQDRCFATDHKDLEPHRGMKLKECDDDDEGRDPKECGIDGSPIDLAVSPLVIRIGDTGGLDQTIRQNIKKAVVWVLDPGKVPVTTPKPTTNQADGEAINHHPMSSETTPLYALQSPNSEREQIQMHGQTAQNRLAEEIRPPTPVADCQFIGRSLTAGASDDKFSQQEPHLQSNTHNTQPGHGHDGHPVIKREQTDDLVLLSSGVENSQVPSKSKKLFTEPGRMPTNSPQQDRKKRNRQSHPEKRQRRGARTFEDCSSNESADRDDSGDYEPGAPWQNLNPPKRPRTSSKGQTRGPGEDTVQQRGYEEEDTGTKDRSYKQKLRPL
ncbi:hypothetical protein PV08_00299 [Exophiala spinifera]|uniref:Uncharacterized protein n=1 Tax=Exophiala spinifera TaxID=91928 RepID=A0A0D2BM94_9EURO|nr:uncharacterized protein PV08_00299 [Exophiala spinifera]KIW19725.1 hypothetical protein PV08_00299 [Exophiala spinifera]